MKMHTHKILAFVLLLALSCLPSFAQSGGTDPQSGDTDPQSSSSDPQAQQPGEQQQAEAQDAETPDQPTIDPFGDEVANHLRFTGSLNTSYEYDDNVFSGGGAKVSDNIFNVSSRFSMTVRKKRSGFQLHYAPGYRRYVDFENRSSFSQSLSNSIDHAFTGRTSLQWNARLSERSSGSNSGVTFENVNGVVVPVYHPDGLQSQARVLSSHAGLVLAHRFSARSTVQVGVNGGTTNFFEENNVPLLAGRSREQFSAGTLANWSYQLRRGKFIGVSFSQQYLGFLSPGSHVNYQQAQLTYRQEFRNGVGITLGGGPAFSQSSQPGISVASTSYSLSAGMDFVRRGSQFALGYNRGVSLGSLQGSIVRDGLSASFNRAFLRRWTAGGSVSYARSQNVTGATRDLESLGIGANAHYRLTSVIGISAQFHHANQFGNSNTIYSSNFDRNTFSMGLSYRFGTEQGR
jgi:hypothetical protein